MLVGLEYAIIITPIEITIKYFNNLLAKIATGYPVQKPKLHQAGLFVKTHKRRFRSFLWFATAATTLTVIICYCNVNLQDKIIQLWNG